MSEKTFGEETFDGEAFDYETFSRRTEPVVPMGDCEFVVFLLLLGR